MNKYLLIKKTAYSYYMAYDLVSVSLRRNIQSFRIIKYSTQIGHSLTIRLLLGVLLDIPLSGLILYVAMERLGFLLFDAFYTRQILSEKDSIGMGTKGVFIKILSDVLLFGTLVSLGGSPKLSLLFLGLSALGMGVGQALGLNNFDQYYKDTVRGYLKNFIGKSRIIHKAMKPLSFSTLYLCFNLLVIALIFSVSYFLYFYYKPELILLIPVLLNTLLLLKVNKDKKKFLNIPEVKESSLPPLRPYLSVRNLHLMLVNSLSMACLLPSCYFLAISLFHDPGMQNQYNVWVVFGLFTLGYEYLGSWGAQALASLPIKNHKVAMITTVGILLLTTLLFTRINILDFDFLPTLGSYWLFISFPLIMSSGLKFIGTLSLHEIMGDQKSRHPQLLSITHYPGHILVIAYCLYLLVSDSPFPTPAESLQGAFDLTLGLSILVALYLFLKKSDPSKEVKD